MLSESGKLFGMQINTAPILDLAQNLTIFQALPAMMPILRRAVQGQPHAWRLPEVACLALGGSPQQALPAVVAIACVQLSLILVDDLLDDDPRGEHHQLGAAQVANLALAFQAAAAETVMASQLSLAARSRLLANLANVSAQTAIGQHQDSAGPQTEMAYWEMVAAKSGIFFGAALATGAEYANAAERQLTLLNQLGRLYGEITQLHDDIGDCLATPANPDWTTGRYPLPILYATVVQHSERERFQALRRQADDPGCLAEAQMILVRCGAISYCIDQLLRRYAIAKNLLSQISAPEPRPLTNLLESLVQPVEELWLTLTPNHPGAWQTALAEIWVTAA